VQRMGLKCRSEASCGKDEAGVWPSLFILQGVQEWRSVGCANRSPRGRDRGAWLVKHESEAWISWYWSPKSFRGRLSPHGLVECLGIAGARIGERGLPTGSIARRRGR